MPTPPLLSSRSPAGKVLVAVVLPCAFGALSGVMLGIHEIAYLVLVVPIGLAGGYFAGLEHQGGPAGAAPSCWSWSLRPSALCSASSAAAPASGGGQLRSVARQLRQARRAQRLCTSTAA